MKKKLIDDWEKKFNELMKGFIKIMSEYHKKLSELPNEPKWCSKDLSPSTFDNAKKQLDNAYPKPQAKLPEKLALDEGDTLGMISDLWNTQCELIDYLQAKED